MRRASISSVSSASSAASSADVPSEETIQIFVKNLSGAITPLTLPASTTTAHLKSLLAVRHNLPASDLRLVFAGRHLTSPDTPLRASGVGPNATLHVALPLRGGRKPACDYKKDTPGEKQCTAQAQRIVGDCGFCGGHFCSKHRLLESHNCPKLEDCKKESHQRNREKLESERTVVVRGV